MTHAQFTVCSVVPRLTDNLEKIIHLKKPNSCVWVVGKNVSVSVPMNYRKEMLGTDRLVNLYGALERYRPPFLVVDFGTAITFDYVSHSGVFEGGLIVPGVELSWRALQNKAALLHGVGPIKSPRGFLGRNTKQAMYSGILNGYGALADGLIERFRKRYGRRIKVIATGGLVSRVVPYARHLDHVDPLHTIRSLFFIFRNEVGNPPSPLRGGR